MLGEYLICFNILQQQKKVTLVFSKFTQNFTNFSLVVLISGLLKIN